MASAAALTCPLIEFNLAAGRIGDELDVVDLIRANAEQIEVIRQHLAAVHGDCLLALDGLVERPREQRDQ